MVKSYQITTTIIHKDEKIEEDVNLCNRRMPIKLMEKFSKTALWS